MKLDAVTCRGLSRSTESGLWYRAILPAYLPTALQASQSMRFPSRFNAGADAEPPFPTLYLAENQVVAMYEVQALFGSPLTPVPNPHAGGAGWVLLQVEVRLRSVVDLIRSDELTKLETSVQELTGDWRNYARSSSRIRPPTHLLGQALHAQGDIEAFRTASARLPGQRVLVVFPDRLASGSRIATSYRDEAGVMQIHFIEPNGPR